MLRHAWMVAAVIALGTPGAVYAQGVLHIRVTVLDASQSPIAVPRHALLISDNPATSEPRRVVTSATGTADVRLKPGSYTVESDQPFGFAGKAYQWTQMIDMPAAGDAALALTAENAEVTALAWSANTAAATGSDSDPSSILATWQNSVVAVWSPGSRGTGFVVDRSGLIATDRSTVGTATSVAVQLSPAVKVQARVLSTDAGRNAAILWIDPSSMGQMAPVPIACSAAPTLDERQEVMAVAALPRRGTDVMDGMVTALHPRIAETDMRLPFGAAGAPVFSEAGLLIGLTSVPAGSERRQRIDGTIVRVPFICEALAAARAAMAGASPPPSAGLPVEPERPYPVGALEAAAKSRDPLLPPVVSSADFEVALITPPMVIRGEQRADWTGGTSTRPPEAEARIGRVVEFGDWSDYFADHPPVLVVRVTPRMVEGFWKRLGREAARTQGAMLPPLKDFKANFLRMRASCGTTDITPIHPMVLEHRLSEKDTIREGLYVFPLDALGPHCGGVTLSLYSEKAPDRADTVSLDAAVIDRVWQDAAPYVAGRP